MSLIAGDLVLFKESLVRDVPAAGVKKAGENFYVSARATQILFKENPVRVSFTLPNDIP